ncbi:MAG: fluoride efflux transporter CrcB [Prevotella sp.]|jgi:CrcB protein
MWKDFLIVSVGSFFGGGSRFLVSRLIQAVTVAAFPFGTFLVNILGCLLIGFFSGLPTTETVVDGWMSPSARLLLTMGFCGGFTTFSTFMNESILLVRDTQIVSVALYLSASLVLGFLAVLAGYEMAKLL